MRYEHIPNAKDTADMAKALGLSADRSFFLNCLIKESIETDWKNNNGMVSMDAINRMVAPQIETPEDAFYAATMIIYSLAPKSPLQENHIIDNKN